MNPLLAIFLIAVVLLTCLVIAFVLFWLSNTGRLNTGTTPAYYALGDFTRDTALSMR